MRYVLLMLAMLFSTPAFAWPEKNITMVVPVNAGNVMDIVARKVAARLEPLLNTKIIVENRVGGTSTLGTKSVINAEPDGYTMLFGGNVVLTGSLTIKSANFDPLTDLTPIGTVADTNLVFLANKSYKTFDVLKATKELNISAIQFGSPSYFVAKYFQLKYNLKDMGIVTYKSTPDAIIDVIGKRIDGGFFPEQLSYQYDKDVVWFDVVDVPITYWLALFYPVNVPEPIVQIVRDALYKLIREHDFSEELIKLRFIPLGLTLDNFKYMMTKEIDLYKNLMNQLNIEPR